MWGHAWQALLLRFDNGYLRLGRFDDGLAAVLLNSPRPPMHPGATPCDV